MTSYLKEKIGNPDLFTGRTKEIGYYLKWVENIKKEISPSLSLVSRRKTGKTALLQRMYNLIFEMNSGVIPFYYELGEGKKWAKDFCKDFFLRFIYQYIAFKTRKPEYLQTTEAERTDFSKVLAAARKEGLDYLEGSITGIEFELKNGGVDLLWDLVREAPMNLATRQHEFIVQIIDEFQFLNSEIYWDEAKTNRATDFAAGYMRTAEYKNAPLLVSGSWVGWLRHELTMMLPGRFRELALENMPQDEAIETVFNYSRIFEIPVTEETACMIAELSEGNPFYISSLFTSQFREKDLCTKENLLRTLEFETRNHSGGIRKTWMEYVDSAFSRINEKNAKKIVLYLCKHRDRQVTRKELLEKLNLKMDDAQLEKKLKSLVKSDIIEQGQTNYDYQGVDDNIFDKVFRGIYQKEIEAFDEKEITNEYKALFEASQKKYNQLLGKFNRVKGLYAEFLIMNQLRSNAFQNNEKFKAVTHNLPKDFRFVEYESVWSYRSSPVDKRDLLIDIYAKAPKNEYTIIGEVKRRDTKKFSEQESEGFLKKAELLKSIESISKSICFVFSLTGFTKKAIQFFEKHQIAWSDDDLWL